MKFMNARTLLTSLSIMLLAASLTTGCASKKKAEDNSSQSNAAPAIDDTAMSFDSAGSDSQKIEGLHTIHFAFDKAALDKTAKDLLVANADWMKKHPQVKVQIEGHCDARGSIEYNLALGERRAKTAMEYMTNLGISADRISVISYGKEKPLDNGDSEEAYAKNRRGNFLPIKN